MTHDARGNTTAVGSDAFGFDARNRLTSSSGAGGAPGGGLSYDPAGRLYEESPSGESAVRFLHAGARPIAEENASGGTLRRYVPGAGVDDTLVWYEGAGLADRRFLLTDPRGSIAAVTDDGGAAIAVNRYDEFGAPHANNLGRFGFTGQMYMENLGLHHYKARAYHAGVGRFLQTDPIGYGDGMNMYAYVGNDPVNMVDPTGMFGTCRTIQTWREITWYRVDSSGKIVETGVTAGEFNTERSCDTNGGGAGGGGSAGGGGGGSAGGGTPGSGRSSGSDEDIDKSLCGSASEGFQGVAPPPAATAQNNASAALKNLARLLAPLAIHNLLQPGARVDTYRHYSYAEYAAGFADGLRPGSFATTSAGPVLTGTQAQQLLALPHPTPPDSFYQVTISRGSVPVEGPSPVQPDYGQPGGGVEYFFPKGTPPGTVLGPFPLPEDCE